MAGCSPPVPLIDPALVTVRVTIGFQSPDLIDQGQAEGVAVRVREYQAVRSVRLVFEAARSGALHELCALFEVLDVRLPAERLD